jgi:hypothetical protein
LNNLKKERPMVFAIGLFVPWHRGKCWLTPVRSIKLYREALLPSNRPSNRYLTVMCCSNPGGRPVEHSRKFPTDDRAFLGSLMEQEIRQQQPERQSQFDEIYSGIHRNARHKPLDYPSFLNGRENERNAE